METIKEKIKQGKGKEENAVEQEVGKVPRHNFGALLRGDLLWVLMLPDSSFHFLFPLV